MGVMLVVLSGLPGCGKSAIADALGRQLPAPVLSVDPIEAAIIRCGIPRSFETGIAAYSVATALAGHQLMLGLPMIADAVNSLEVAREMWREAARHASVSHRAIEVVCSGMERHRNRLASRVRNIEGFPEPTWDEVQARRSEWEDWREHRLVLDSADPFEDNVQRALAYVRHDLVP